MGETDGGADGWRCPSFSFNFPTGKKRLSSDGPKCLPALLDSDG